MMESRGLDGLRGRGGVCNFSMDQNVEGDKAREAEGRMCSTVHRAEPAWHAQRAHEKATQLPCSGPAHRSRSATTCSIKPCTKMAAGDGSSGYTAQADSNTLRCNHCRAASAHLHAVQHCVNAPLLLLCQAVLRGVRRCVVSAAITAQVQPSCQDRKGKVEAR